jgi:hypothetical protein
MSPASDAGNISETRLILQVERVRESRVRVYQCVSAIRAVGVS